MVTIFFKLKGIKIYDSNYQIINDPEPEFSFTGNNVINLQKVLKINDEDNKEPLDTFYSFVLTDYELNRTYCTCLVFNVNIPFKGSKKSLLKMMRMKLLILWSWKILLCSSQKMRVK